MYYKLDHNASWYVSGKYEHDACNSFIYSYIYIHFCFLSTRFRNPFSPHQLQPLWYHGPKQLLPSQWWTESPPPRMFNRSMYLGTSFITSDWQQLLLHLEVRLSSFCYAPNFNKVDGAYCCCFVRPFVCSSILDISWYVP